MGPDSSLDNSKTRRGGGRVKYYVYAVCVLVALLLVSFIRRDPVVSAVDSNVGTHVVSNVGIEMESNIGPKVVNDVTTDVRKEIDSKEDISHDYSWLEGLPVEHINRMKHESKHWKVRQEQLKKELVLKQLEASSKVSKAPSSSLLDSPNFPHNRVLLFIIIRSEMENRKVRNAARSTWLSTTGLISSRHAQYKFFVNQQNCCQNETDVIAASPSWLNEKFTNEYGAKSLFFGSGGNAVTENYARDWNANLVQWAVQHYDFKFLVIMDDESFLCGPNLISQLQLLPSTLSSFVFGYRRAEALDNSFQLFTRDVADFFAASYYKLLRPTHHSSIRFKTKGSSFGNGWSNDVGDWQKVFQENGFKSLVFRNGGVSESCHTCTRELIRKGKKGDLCNSGREKYWNFKCSNMSIDFCKMPDCFPDPDHRCHSPLVDYRPAGDWKKLSSVPDFYFHDTSSVCASRFVLSKVKSVEDIHKWWSVTGPHRLDKFKDISNYLMYPNKDMPKLCFAVDPEEPAKVGIDVHPTLNFQHKW